MSSPIVIGISGKKRHGKDTLGSIISKVISERTHFPVFRYALADPLKEEVADFLGIRMDELERLKNEPDSPERLILQGVGQSRRRDNPDYWIDKWKESVRGVYGVVIVSDVRYPNEVELIKSYINYYLIRVNRIGVVTNDSHTSETALDDYEDFDCVLLNDTLDKYKERCEALALALAERFTNA